MRRINLVEIRHDGKEPRKFVYLYADEKNPRPRIHQVEHYTDNVTESNLLEAVVVSKHKFEEVCLEYKKTLDENNNVLSRDQRAAIEQIAYEENFVPDRRGMLLFYHPQMNEIRGREIQPPKVD